MRLHAGRWRASVWWLVAFACVAGCSEPELVVEDWTLSANGQVRSIALPAHLGEDVVPHGDTYTLRTQIEVPAAWRGGAVGLSIPHQAGRIDAYANGRALTQLLGTRSGYRGTSHAWVIPDDVVATGRLDLELAVQHTWTQSAWLDTRPRLTPGPSPVGTTRVVYELTRWVTALSAATLMTIAFTYFVLFLFDRRGKAFLYLTIQTALPVYYCLFISGATQHLTGDADLALIVFSISGAVIMAVYAVHAHLSLRPPHRAWLLAWLVVGISGLTTIGTYKQGAYPTYGTVAILATGVTYVTAILLREARRRRDFDTYTHLASWIALCLTTPVDGLAWVGLGELLGGFHPAPVGLTLFAFLQFVALAREMMVNRARSERLNVQLEGRMAELEAHQTEVENLNAELRQQIAERSRDLSEFLGRLAAGHTSELNPGTVVDDRYEVIRQLGSGASGTVYEVRRATDDARLAMKVLAEGRDVHKLARFAREARLACEVRHENVVEVADVGFSASGFMYLILEYVDGSSLKEMREWYKDAVWALPLLSDIAEGLAAIHAAGIVHRDLKPANILVAEAHGAQTAKLTDFGISGVVDDVEIGAPGEPPEDATETVLPDLPTPAPLTEQPEVTLSTQMVPGASSSPRKPLPAWAGTPSSSSSELTRTGMIMGTPKYMAPELADGRRNDAPAADIYSFGVVAFELLTGAAPHAEPLLMTLLRKAAVKPTPTLADLRADLPADVTGVIDRCLARDPGARPSAAEVAASLSAAG